MPHSLESLNHTNKANCQRWSVGHNSEIGFGRRARNINTEMMICELKIGRGNFGNHCREGTGASSCSCVGDFQDAELEYLQAREVVCNGSKPVGSDRLLTRLGLRGYQFFARSAAHMFGFKHSIFLRSENVSSNAWRACHRLLSSAAFLSRHLCLIHDADEVDFVLQRWLRPRA